jgi:hypothetical protein
MKCGFGKAILGVLIIILDITPGKAEPGAVEALCGPPPALARTAPEEIRAQESELRRIEREMPPVTDQGKTDWCFAHVAAGLLEHFLHQKTGLAYDSRTLVSPVDLAEEGSFYLGQNAVGKTSSPGSADYNGKQDPIDVLLCVQGRGAVRSLSQLLSFVSDEDAAERALARSLAEEQRQARRQRQTNAAALGETALGSNPSVVNLRFNWEVLRGWVQGDFSRAVLQNYEQIISVAGTPDLRMPPFVINRYTTRDPVKAASRIRQLLQSGEPVALFFRGRDVPGDWQAFDPGETHIMTIVGAGYVGNRPPGPAQKFLEHKLGGWRLHHLARRGFSAVAKKRRGRLARTVYVDMDRRRTAEPAAVRGFGKTRPPRGRFRRVFRLHEGRTAIRAREFYPSLPLPHRHPHFFQRQD